MSHFPDLSRRFKLGRRLGGGGCADVYEAQDACGAVFAFKIPKGAPTRLFEREVNLAGRLDHPNVARVHGFGTAEDDRRGLVSEYVAGGDLGQRLSYGPLSADEFWPLARGIAAGLDHAHRRRVLHRDLKPANILIADGRTPKLIDFGIASELIGSLAIPTHWAFTPFYGPPEQIRRDVVLAPQGDVYSFAVVLYQCLTGRFPLPFPAERNELRTVQLLGEWFAVVQEGVLVPAPEIPRPAWDVLRQALDRDYRRRPNSARHLVRELRRAWRGEPPRRSLRYGGPSTAELGKCGWPKRVVHEGDHSVMVLVEDTTFLMGHGEGGDDGPAHKVALSPYYIDACPVTNRQFAQFLRKCGYVPRGPWQRHYQSRAAGDHPVRDVTYADAVAYCNEYKKELPSEAQWECAARAGTGNVYPWGNEYRPRRAWCGRPLPEGPFFVGAFEPNAWGVFDAAGNVAEWVRDWYLPGIYADRARGGLVRDPIQATSGDERGVRGGHWASGPDAVRCTVRDKLAPKQSLPTVGFRTVWRPGDDN